MSYFGNHDPWMEHAKQVIFADYAVNVSLEAKNKDLLKFGRHENVQTTKTTLMTLPAGIYNETYVTDNLINSIISTSTADGETITIEGHTLAAGNFTFTTQNVVLTGQTEVALGTALARVTRAFNISATELAGVVSISETNTYSSGVPVTAALVHLQIRAGEQQSEKAATTISSVDYWVITSIYADMLEKTAASADVQLEVQRSGGVFRQVTDMSASSNHRGFQDFKPYIIVPSNADVRLRAAASANDKDVSGGIIGALLKA